MAGGCGRGQALPGVVGRPGFVREMRGPFPDIPLVPTGGVTVETAPAFIAAGAVAVGMGGWLLGDGAPAGIRERAAAVVAAVAPAAARRQPDDRGRHPRGVPHRVRGDHARPAGRGDHLRALRRRRRGERRGRARAARSFGRVHRSGRCRWFRRGDRAPPPGRGRRHLGPRDRPGRRDRAACSGKGGCSARPRSSTPGADRRARA